MISGELKSWTNQEFGVTWYNRSLDMGILGVLRLNLCREFGLEAFNSWCVQRKKWMQSLKNLESNMKCSLVSMESSRKHRNFYCGCTSSKTSSKCSPQHLLWGITFFVASTNLGPSGYPRIHWNPMLCSLFPPSHRVALSWLSPIFCKIPLMLLIISHYIPILSSLYPDKSTISSNPHKNCWVGFPTSPQSIPNQSPTSPFIAGFKTPLIVRSSCQVLLWVSPSIVVHMHRILRHKILGEYMFL